MWVRIYTKGVCKSFENKTSKNVTKRKEERNKEKYDAREGTPKFLYTLNLISF